MEHGLELITARLEILEIEVFNILYKPRDIGNLSFSTSSYPGNIGNLIFPIFPYPGNLGGGRVAPLVRFSRLGLVLEDCFFPYFSASWKY